MASKEADGYPHRNGQFFNPPGTQLTTAFFSADHIEEDVVVPLGRKGGILKGTVKEAVTGKGVNANVEFRWVSDPRNFVSASGWTNAQFRIVVPSEIAFTMVVSLDGYKSWTYASSLPPFSRPIELRPGEELTLDIRLTPKR